MKELAAPYEVPPSIAAAKTRLTIGTRSGNAVDCLSRVLAGFLRLSPIEPSFGHPFATRLGHGFSSLSGPFFRRNGKHPSADRADSPSCSEHL